LGLSNCALDSSFLILLCVITCLAGQDDPFCNFWVYEIPMTTFASAIREAGTLEISDQLPNFSRHIELPLVATDLPMT
jgi:hypothetical protein